MASLIPAVCWLLSIYPGLPEAWPTTPLLRQVQAQGMQMDIWQLQISQLEAFEWRTSHRPRCTVISPPQAIDWYCLDENSLYSLIPNEDTFLWIQSERRKDLAKPELPFSAELFSQYQQGTDEVSLLQTRQPLYRLQAQLLRRQRETQARLMMHQQHEHGFVMQWHVDAERFVVTAQRDPDGLVNLVYVKGRVQ
ncbi:hypothetical protein CWE12_03715 [Aliidiomarina sedimenti]|uniref:Uncharacterized protein n=2 Tax=Aliidiomarina sedimenti TaxID=1933879 RepID=A0ABY0C2Y3_9GAMM|nr:hypothetical protein CWE12_03715 [Aliidiomarina sedimenti]